MSLLSTNSTITDNPQKEEIKPIVFYYLAMTVLLYLLVMYIACYQYIKDISRRRKSKLIGEITNRPIFPPWLPSLDTLSHHLIPRITILSRPYIEHSWELQAIDWCQNLMITIFGRQGNRPRVIIPDEACVVAVPMMGFKCGGPEHTDFEPIASRAPGDHFTYQMFGDNRVQVITYHSNGTSRVAGYCIFIRMPYCRKASYHYCSKMIKNLHKREPRIQIDESIDNQLITDSLQSKFCKKREKPVLVGFYAGRNGHYQWNDKFKAYQFTPCESCEDDDKGPPRYSSLL